MKHLLPQIFPKLLHVPSPDYSQARQLPLTFCDQRAFGNISIDRSSHERRAVFTPSGVAMEVLQISSAGYASPVSL